MPVYKRVGMHACALMRVCACMRACVRGCVLCRAALCVRAWVCGTAVGMAGVSVGDAVGVATATMDELCMFPGEAKLEL